MAMTIKSLEPLATAVPASDLFRDWITGSLDAAFLAPEHRDARREIEMAFAASQALEGAPSPLFSSGWVAGWSASMAEDCPGPADRERFLAQVGALQSGAADVVVTGQQPGYLGGPLYTLFKVATAVALAAGRTAAGRPTFPVFWSGDDDDDLAEALEPVAWQPRESRTVGGGAVTRSPGAGSRSPIIGRMESGTWMDGAAAYLAGLSVPGRGEKGRLVRDLAEIWDEARDQGWSWARLSRRTLLRVFSGQGLMVVSGDDPGLHRAAGPLYERILAGREQLSRLAEERGRQLASGPWHAQITARSLARPLFTAEGDRRVPMEPDLAFPDPAVIRPGVMLRSPIQDWLLRPAAVVVGPGELAYLRQLDPVYGELGVDRPPLVPRLFAWLVPEGFEPGQLTAFTRHPAAESDLAGSLAEEAEEKVRRILEEILVARLGLAEDRARDLSAGRARRWGKGVEAMLRGEIKQARLEVAAPGPAWVFPEGERQERRLAYLSAAALWGDDLAAAGLDAAARHLAEGRRGNWREFSIQVPDPEPRED